MAAFIGYNQEQQSKLWVIDSGATTNMTGSLAKDQLEDSPPAPLEMSVTVGNGTKLQVSAISDTVHGQVKLQDVWHVPGLTANLVSISKALDNGVDEITFKRNNMSVTFSRNGKAIATGSRQGDLFA